MRVLQLHTNYVYPGGEDTVVELECELLRRGGHTVEQLSASNRELGEDRRFSVRGAGRGLLKRRRLHSELVLRLDRQRPDVVHVHNSFAQFGSAIYDIAAEHDVPVVQTVHNYRFTCAHAGLLRDGRPCEDCVGGSRWPALRHRCYRDSLPLTAAALTLQWEHARAWRGGKVHTFIAPSSFVRDRLVRDGIDSGRVVVKPHFTAEPTETPGAGRRPRQVVFAGWMVEEKGLDLLLEAWDRVAPPDAELVMAGEGPMRRELQARYARLDSVRWLGWVEREALNDELGRSIALVTASRAYESFGLVVIEAFAMGTPALAPRHGAFLEVIEEGRTGFFFEPGSVDDLARSLERLLGVSEAERAGLSTAARQTYLERYTPAGHLAALEQVYASAMSDPGGRT